MNSCTVSQLGVGSIFGLAFVVEAGLLSIVFVLAFFALVARNVFIQKRHPFQSHIDIYVTSLSVADLFQGVVATMSLRWAQTGRVECGIYCTTQGFLYQFGQTGVAMSTLAVTVHTFCIVFFRWRPPPSKLVPLCVVACIWLYNLCFSAIGYGTHTGKGGTQPFYVPTPFWCSVYLSVPTRLASQYIWIDLAIFTSIVLYIPLFFSVRGYIEAVPTSKKWYSYKIELISDPDRRRKWMNNPHPSAKIRSAAMKMLWHPVVHSITALPANLLRWEILNHLDRTIPVQDIRFAPIAVAYFLVNASGIINVMLFIFTRPNILLFGEQGLEENGRDFGGTVPSLRLRPISVDEMASDTAEYEGADSPAVDIGGYDGRGFISIGSTSPTSPTFSEDDPRRGVVVGSRDLASDPSQ